VNPQVRVLILIPALPGLFFLALQGYGWYLQGTSADFSFLFFGYGLLSCYLIYLSVTGKEPAWLHKEVEHQS
jgi:hypothetical protein